MNKIILTAVLLMVAAEASAYLPSNTKIDWDDEVILECSGTDERGREIFVSLRVEEAKDRVYILMETMDVLNVIIKRRKTKISFVHPAKALEGDLDGFAALDKETLELQGVKEGSEGFTIPCNIITDREPFATSL